MLKIENPNISFDSDQLTVDGKTISCHDVSAIKFGYEPIRLDMYTIGSKYIIYLRTEEHRLLVTFKSYFGIGKKAKYKDYVDLLTAIWDSTVGETRQ